MSKPTQAEIHEAIQDHVDDHIDEECCGCVFCDLDLTPTECTDGWFHLMDDGRAVLCTKPAQ